MASENSRVARQVWIGMAIAIAVEAIVGVIELRVVPLGRPSSWDPTQGRAVYLAHAAIGVVIGLVAISLYTLCRDAPRFARLGSLIGLIGVGTAGVGGFLSAYHPVRLVGMAVMFIGAGTAFFAYLIPLGKRSPEASSAT